LLEGVNCHFIPNWRSVFGGIKRDIVIGSDANAEERNLREIVQKWLEELWQVTSRKEHSALYRKG